MRNESKTLPRLAKSLEEFLSRGGKWLTLDTGSTDGSAEIARSLGAEVIEVGEKFIITFNQVLTDRVNAQFVVEGEEPIVKVGDRLFDYASARNYIAGFAPTDWIWCPDIDEVFTKLNLNKVEEAMNNPGADLLEYEFIFAHDQFNQPSIRFRHSKCYKRSKFKWSGVVHEVLVGEGVRKYLPENEVLLEHFQNHETNRTGYLKGLALDCYLNPQNDRNSHYLGRELLWTNRPKSAVKELKRHLTLGTWKAERGQSMIFIGDATQDISWYFNGFNEEPNRREALIRLAEHFYKKNDYLQTAVWAEACLPIKEVGFYANNHEHYTFRPHELLYWAYYYLGDKQKAKYHFDLALSFQPQNEKFIQESKFFYEYPPISVVIPTYCRNTYNLINSLHSDGYLADKEIIVQQDTTGEGCPKTFNKGVEKAKNEIVVFLGDDCIVQKNWLNHAVMKYLNTGHLVALNDGRWYPDWNPKLASYFLAHKSLRKELQGGQFFDERIMHYGCDDFLTKQVQLLGKLSYEPNAVIEETKLQDASTEKALKSRAEDRKILDNLLLSLV